MAKMTLLKGAAFAVALAFSSGSAMAAETYYTDQGHTEVRFGWSHVGVSMQSGEFTKVDGMLVLDPDDVSKSKLSVTIDANSLSTGYQPLDAHLRSTDFLDVEGSPQITFESTEVRKTGDTTADVTGDLTIRGVTRPVTLKTTLTHRGDHPMGAYFPHYRGKWTAFSATAQIDHQAFKVGNFSTGPITIWISTEMKDRKDG